MSDKSKTPTGVFVRLPLSEEQRRAMYDVAGDVSMETAILAIGTPVAGGELKPVAFMRPNDHASPGVSFRSFEGYIPLVRQSDAQTALAAAQAESVRLRRALQEIHDTGHDLPEFMRIEMMVAEAEKALKGPEA